MNNVLYISEKKLCLLRYFMFHEIGLIIQTYIGGEAVVWTLHPVIHLIFFSFYPPFFIKILGSETH